MARVLVVEDSLALTKVMEHSLRTGGLDVAVAHDGLEGWEVLQEHSFDLVVFDYQMPRMNGRELRRRMLDHPSHRHIPAILVTAKALEMELPRLRKELDLLEVFAKPFSPRAFTKSVMAHLSLPAR